MPCQDHTWETFPELTQPVCIACGELAPYDLDRFESYRRSVDRSNERSNGKSKTF